MSSTPGAAPGTPPAAEPRSRAVMFESLFVHALEPEGAFLADLKAAGFDPAAIQPDYPHRVLNACVAVAHKHLCPELSYEQARWRFGRLFNQGMSRTLLGKVLVAALPLLGPARYLKKVPDYLKVDSADIEGTPHVLGEREVRVDFRAHPAIDPEFIAGLLEEGVTMTRVTPVVTLTKHAPGSFSVLVRW